MKLSELVPSADLLEKLEGLEHGLQRRRRLGRLGKLGTVFAVLTWLSSVLPQLPSSLKDWLSRLPAPWGAIVTAGLVLALLLAFIAILFSFWLKESRRPIRYTCSLGHFSVVSSEDNKPSSPVEEKMNWLRHDLAQRLNQRVGRLMFLFSPDAEPPAQPAGKEAANGQRRLTDQHIHIEGVYRLQERSPGNPAYAKTRPEREIVVMPRVRIGHAGSPERLAKPVYYRLRADQRLFVKDYEDLVEQVYFNIVTEVYQQIRHDVERKIALLPTRRHKAVAYYYEAEDYARSNTLCSYEEAGQLYREASRYFEPFNPLVNPFPKSRLLRMWRTLDTAVDALTGKLYHLMFYVRPTMARHEILAAKAKLGYANMLLFRSWLSELLGQRRVPIFEARRFAELALVSVTRVPEDAPGRKACLFDSHVTNALSWSLFNDYAQSRHHLHTAKSYDPPRATTSALYLLVESLAPSEPQQKYEVLVRAVEQDPSFEIARFSKAYQGEMRWRRGSTPTSARIDAEGVIKGYRDVLKLNPSNIAAAGNAAFVLWALLEKEESDKAKDIEEAKDLLDRALRYNELAPETVVVEHHYDLARIHAEEGQFKKAYEHLIKAEDGRRAHRSTHSVDPVSYFFNFVGDDLRRRYETYCGRVIEHASRQKSDEENASVRNAVCAFVLDEYGQACWSHYLRLSRDEQFAKAAKNAFKESIAKDKTYVMSHYHLAKVCTTAQERTDLLEKVTSLDPSWQDVLLERATHEAAGCSGMWKTASACDEEARSLIKLEKERNTLESLRKKRMKKEREIQERDIGIGRSCVVAPASDDKQLSDIRRESTATEKRIEKLSATLPGLARDAKDLSLLEMAENAKRKAEDLRTQVRSRIDEVQKKARLLLPHVWLWSSAGHAESDFNEKCLTKTRFREEAKWEREFDIIQARALYQWTKTLLWPSGAVSELGRSLLHHIKQVFFPADIMVVLECHEIATDKKDLELQAWHIVNGWLLEDPCERVALDWLEDPKIAVVPDERTKRLIAAKESGPLPRHLLQLLAHKPMEDANRHFMDSRESTKAIESYRRVLDLDAGGPETALAAGRLAVLLFADNKLKEAESLVEQSLPKTYTFLPSAVKDPGGDVERFLRQNELARIELKLCYERRLRTATDRHATDAVMGLLSVRGYKECLPTEYNNVRTPLAVEWDEELLHADVNDFLVNEAAPLLRQQLEARYGVSVPGVRFRALTEVVRPGLYRILDHEVVVEEGVANGRSPVSAQDMAPNWQYPLRFTMERLANYLEGNLSQWIRVQEVQNLLESHCQERYHISIPDSIPEIETHKHIGHLTIVIRSLVAERVPIREFSKIYDLYRSLWDAGEHIQAITREIRKDRTIRPELWGNTQEYQRFILSQLAEGELWEACESIDGFTILVLNPERREEVISAIVAGLKAEGKKSLTVRRATLRPLVRRLIEQNLPGVPVLAEEEIECHVRTIECIEITIPPSEESQRGAI